MADINDGFIFDDDTAWYKDAIIYEVHVRAFNDSNEDGIGDFQGLTDKLDYLQDFGVTPILRGAAPKLLTSRSMTAGDKRLPTECLFPDPVHSFAVGGSALV